jgi:flagellar motor switch protein FliN/FliY
VDNQIKHQGAQVFASAFGDALAQVLTQKIGRTWQLRILDSPNLNKRQEKPIHFRLKVEGPLQGECFVELYELEAAELGSTILGQHASSFSSEHVDALAEVISAALDGLASALIAEFGTLTLSVSRVEDLVFGGMFAVPLASSGGEQADIQMMLYFDGRLLTALTSAFPKTAPEEERPAMDSKNLDLVMDVELNVSLRFGQCKLPLREVLDLASGSVIELDRDVDDPVELLLDGKVIARGEAVIVDGNYGLRVTEIPQPIATHFIR